MNTFIFDLDGVLVDTAKYHYLAWKEISDKYRFNFSEQINEKLKGVSRAESLEVILNESNKNINDTQKGHILEEKNKIYLSFISKITPAEVLPGVINILEFAKKNDICICLGSASKNARQILDKVALTDYFDCIIDGTDVLKAKPDPEVFLKGAYRLGVSPDECIVFEDSVAGIDAALIAGMKSVGVGNNKTLHKANIIVNNLEEIDFSELL